MKQLVIVGAGGCGRELFFLAKESLGYGTDFVIKGFIDDNIYALDGFDNYPPLLGKIEDYIPEHDDVFSCAMGNVRPKKKCVDIIQGKGGTFINIIHKSAVIRENSTLGLGCIICDGVFISCDVQIGDFVTVQRVADFGHDVKIGNFCQFNANTFMGGGAKAGSMVTVHTGAIITPGIEVGDNCTINAASVVIRNVKNGQTVFGIPAKPLLVPQINK